MQAGMVATTALMPRNGRYHVRARALNQPLDGLEDVVTEGILFRLQRRALVTARPLDGLEPKTFRWVYQLVPNPNESDSG